MAHGVQAEQLLQSIFGSGDRSQLTLAEIDIGKAKVAAALRTEADEAVRLSIWLALDAAGMAPIAAQCFSDLRVLARAEGVEAVRAHRAASK